MTDLKKWTLTQQFNFKKGLKKFGDKGKEAVVKEVRQQQACKCFEPVAVNELTQQEKQ